MELLSYYTAKESKVKKDISILDYVNFVKEGTGQDLVIQARNEFQKNGKSEAYTRIKSQAQCVMGSAVMNSGPKTAANIKELNGLIVMDIDTELTDALIDRLRRDKYTYVLHYSFSGEGICIFVKINSGRFRESFNQLAQYYYENFDIVIDQACKNKNRLRYISFDPDLTYNEHAEKFKAKAERVKKQKPEKFIFTSTDDVTHILKQIQDKGIDLVRGEYDRFVRLGFALYDGFGDAGKDYLHIINQNNPRYKPKNLEKDWRGFRKKGSITVATFYHLCKEEGIELFTERSKDIINRVKVAKAQGNPTVKSINKNLTSLGESELTESEREFASKLIESKVDLSSEANKDVSEIEQIERFIIDAYAPKRDVINDVVYIRDNERMNDNELNDIYISCKKSLPFKVPISDVQSIINSNSIGKLNRITDFINQNKDVETTGVIDKYVNCIHPRTDYNVWAFKKWIVGAIHNWTSPNDEKLVSPLTLVLTGSKHGTGKTSFFRNILPSELQLYFVEGKINAHDKDSQYLLATSLMVFDDEFGGKAFKDVKEYKAISDMNTITQRRPYGKTVSTFKRRAALCGTSNEVDVLKDVTGNRRILPINVERIDFDEMVKIDKTELIMEAYNLYREGFQWKIYNKEDIDFLNENTADNNAVLPLEEILLNHFALEKVNSWDVPTIMNQGDLLEFLHEHTMQKPNKHELKDVLTKNGLIYKNHRVGGRLKKGIALYPVGKNKGNSSDDLPY